MVGTVMPLPSCSLNRSSILSATALPGSSPAAIASSRAERAIEFASIRHLDRFRDVVAAVREDFVRKHFLHDADCVLPGGRLNVFANLSNHRLVGLLPLKSARIFAS